MIEERIFAEETSTIKLDSLIYNEILFDPPKKKKNGIFSENNKKNDLPIIIDYGSGITKAV